MFDIHLEIKRIVEFYNSKLNYANQKPPLEIENIITRVILDYNKNNFDFSNYKSLTINQSSKKRSVKKYYDWSSELFLCIYLKRCLDREFKIKYSNRNEHMHLLFGTIASLKDMNDYVVVRFDFEDFFNSISSSYVYEHFISTSLLERFQKDLFLNFISKCPYCYAGINTSNVMAEILCKKFDKVISNYFHEKGLIFYKRYVDDGILIFNRFISNDECVKIIEKSITDSFYLNKNKCCKTKLNKAQNKFIYISKRNINTHPNKTINFNYLGYQFGLQSQTTKQANKLKTTITYGITDAKIKKYSTRIENIINDFIENKNNGLLQHRIRAFCSRTVYRRKKYSSMVWKVKGFTSNYNELRYHLLNLDTNTEKFLKEGIKTTFLQKKLTLPNFLKDKSDNAPFSMYNNLQRNRTLLFEKNKRIGINFDKLKKMCQQIGIVKFPKETYNSMLREYLIKMKVGH